MGGLVQQAFSAILCTTDKCLDIRRSERKKLKKSLSASSVGDSNEPSKYQYFSLDVHSQKRQLRMTNA